MRIYDGTNAIEVDTIDALGWYTATGTMPAVDDGKWDIQMMNAVVGESSGTVRIYSVCVYELD